MVQKPRFDSPIHGYNRAFQKFQFGLNVWKGSSISFLGVFLGLLPPLLVRSSQKRRNELKAARINAAEGKGSEHKRLALQERQASKLQKPLWDAIDANDVALLKRLLEAFPIANLLDAEGRTPLECVYQQVDAEYQRVNVEGHASRDHLEAMRTLAKNGAKVSDGKGGMLIYRAVMQNQTEVVRLLVESGANNTLSWLFDMAMATNKDTALVRDLLSVTEISMTARHLTLALRSKDKDRIQLVLEACKDAAARKALVNERFKDDWTPLHIACADQLSNDVIALLLQNGANPNTRTIPDRSTPLHTAVVQVNVPVIKMLLAHGADKHAKDMRGLSPMNLATYNGERLGFLFEDELLNAWRLGA